ncbi:MAG: 7-cyano-7-deazaguanine synthase [Thaumarchaeota archaeon]|nr:7-cyano-7-deazaguanine synthase [Nitrososphaerota archaeon]
MYLAKKDGHSVRALTIRIHGTARGELRAARRIGKRAGVAEHRFVTIPELREAGDIAVPGRLSGPAVLPTYIPMKNAIYYSIAASFAEETGSNYIVGGHNMDDRLFFEDTSDEFFRDLQRTLLAGSVRLRESRMRILRPLRRRSKVEVVKLAAELGVPLELTWSCHVDGEEQCGECSGCRQRVESFRAAGIDDPLHPKKA